MIPLREKARMPRAVHGDEWPMLVWGREPPSKFSFFFGRSPDLWSGFFTFGDVEKGFKEADRIIEFKARRRYNGCSDAEPVGGISRWEGDCAELWLHSQHPYEHKWMMNQLLRTRFSKH